MKKHNCHKAMEELRGCSICSSVLKGFRGEELDIAIKKSNWCILEQQREINTLKKLFYKKAIKCKKCKKPVEKYIGEPCTFHTKVGVDRRIIELLAADLKISSKENLF